MVSLLCGGPPGRTGALGHPPHVCVLEAEGPLGPYGPPVALELGDRMSIDGTVLELPDGSLYLAYMGRLPEYNALFLAPMDSPSHISGEPVMISKPDFPGKETSTRGRFYYQDGKVRLLFAANAAHLPDYCLGLLTCGTRAGSWIRKAG